MTGKKNILLFVLLFTGIAIQAKCQKDYPVPAKTDKLLFYLQRSHNRNTVIYDLNTLPNDRINPDKPVSIYWIRYEEGGARKELSFFQQRAFGIQWRLDDKAKESFILHFNCFKKRNIYLIKNNTDNYYKAFISINGEISELTKMYIESENNALGFPLKIKRIEISGISLKNRKDIMEKFIP
jgi:hypothetical protein